MLDVSKLKSAITMLSLQHLIESITGEKYKNLTGAVNGALKKAEDANLFYDWSSGKTSFNALFQSSTIKKLPKMNFEKVENMRYFAQRSSLEIVDYYINSGRPVDYYQAFFECKNLKFVYGVDLSNAQMVYEMFKNCSSLETVQEPLDLAKATNISGIFVGCLALKNVGFIEGCIGAYITFGSCKDLTIESAKSILLGLVNRKGTEKEFTESVIFHNNTWMLLNAEGETAPGNLTWEDYVTEIGWNK